MKARIKATGEIVSVKVVEIGCDYEGRQIFVYEDDKRRCFADNELDFDNLESPDYWTRLEHTYAGMAMQGLMSYVEQITPKKGRSFCDAIVDFSVNVAHALVEKQKKESK